MSSVLRVYFFYLCYKFKNRSLHFRRFLNWHFLNFWSVHVDSEIAYFIQCTRLRFARFLRLGFWFSVIFRSSMCLACWLWRVDLDGADGCWGIRRVLEWDFAGEITAFCCLFYSLKNKQWAQFTYAGLLNVGLLRKRNPAFLFLSSMQERQTVWPKRNVCARMHCVIINLLLTNQSILGLRLLIMHFLVFEQ